MAVNSRLQSIQQMLPNSSKQLLFASLIVNQEYELFNYNDNYIRKIMEVSHSPAGVLMSSSRGHSILSLSIHSGLHFP